MNHLFAVASVVLMVVAAKPALAADTRSPTARLTVDTSVTRACTLSVTPLTFPNISVADIATSQVGTSAATSGPPPSEPKIFFGKGSLEISCSKGSSVTVSMNAGLYGNAAGTQFGMRSMKSQLPSAYVGYDLCRDSDCSTFWTPQGYQYVSTSDDESALPIWGRIKAPQPTPPGTYSDTITVTVSF